VRARDVLSFWSSAASRLPNRAKMDGCSERSSGTTWTVLGLLADIALPFWWGIAATIPLGRIELVGGVSQRLVLAS